MRSLQLLRAPTLMRDYKTLENAIGKSLDHGSPKILGGLGRSYNFVFIEVPSSEAIWTRFSMNVLSVHLRACF